MTEVNINHVNHNRKGEKRIMSLELTAQVWRYSPYEGQRLLLHMALAEAAYPTMAGMEGITELDSLGDKARFRRRDALIEQLENMENDEHLSQVAFTNVEKSWGAIHYVLETGALLKSYEQQEIERLEHKCELLTSQIQHPHPIQGYVYLVKCGEYYKIGRSSNIDRRMEQLAIQLPHKPEVIHVIATATPPELEQFFHRNFSDKRLNGEWFSLDEHDLQKFAHWTRMDRSNGSHGEGQPQLTE
jgi:Meiotically up-regulated gene 113